MPKSKIIYGALTLVFISCYPIEESLTGPEDTLALEIRTNKDMYSSEDDSIVVTIRNTGSRNIYGNWSADVSLFALQNSEVIDSVLFGRRMLAIWERTTFQPGEIVVLKYKYKALVRYAWECNAPGINQFQLRFGSFFLDKESIDPVPTEYLASNAFTLQYLEPFY